MVNFNNRNLTIIFISFFTALTAIGCALGGATGAASTSGAASRYRTASVLVAVELAGVGREIVDLVGVVVAVVQFFSRPLAER